MVEWSILMQVLVPVLQVEVPGCPGPMPLCPEPWGSVNPKVELSLPGYQTDRNTALVPLGTVKLTV